MTNQLIKIEKMENGVQAVSARALYEFLGLDFKNYARWCKANITDNQFAAENEDYSPFLINEEWGGRATTDYTLTLEFAKKLCMVSKTDRGEEARNYFIECERQLQQAQVMLPDFTNPAAAARAWAEQYEAKAKAEAIVQEQEQQIKMLTPAAEFANRLTNCRGFMTIGDAAKLLAIKGYGQNNIFRLLKQKKVLMDTYRAYQRYVENGYFKTDERVYFNEYTQEDRISYQLKVSQKGIAFIKRLIESDRSELLQIEEISTRIDTIAAKKLKLVK